ncbi:hypothetical protein L195_g032690 [Trifolium pratense]|uniref:Uncharacterized protein n=1 Tax=Trifolium pratense TaxID=57577 RepID=A0A2K3LDY4_TRIPR|nr:hypothetical protein L195_g032690 [Trifolium pratense]
MKGETWVFFVEDDGSAVRGGGVVERLSVEEGRVLFCAGREEEERVSFSFY